MFEAITSKFNDQWMQLSDRDKKAAVLLAASLSLSIVIFLVILPIKKYQNDAQDALSRAEATFNELVAIAPQALANNQSGPAFSTSSLNSEIRRQAVRNGLTIQRFEPDGNNLKVWLEEARYPSVVKWLAGLESMGISHAELSLESRNKPGFVTVRATFSLPNS
ncbi:type II secretion system protein GspM [Reinekea sp.]|jgi:type II secretory pathway component PulM|uniref:type II secretion system protein GspM n=1 Tax=Reinekea sp. TaxID=1970455 RepID=UPI0039895A19